MSSLPYLNLASHFSQYGAFLTVCTNALLTNLTIFHVKNISFSYKCLIGLQAVLGIFFSLIELLVHPFLHSFNASYIFFSATFANEESKEWMLLGTLLLGLYSWIYMSIICCLAIQFIYRFFVVISPKLLQLFSGWKMITWVLYLLVFTIGWVLSLLEIYPDNFTKGYLKEEMKKNYKIDISFLPSYQVVAADQNGTFRSSAILGVSGFSLVIVLQYIVIMYCGVFIHSGIRSIATLSPKVHRMHSQLFKTLVLQIAVPSIFYNSPVLLMYIIIFLDLKWSAPSGVMICVFSFYPAIDSFLLLWMVTEYNRTIIKLMHKLLAKIAKLLEARAGESEDTDPTKSKKTTVSMTQFV